jgi:hypothetical protein
MNWQAIAHNLARKLAFNEFWAHVNNTTLSDLSAFHKGQLGDALNKALKVYHEALATDDKPCESKP